MRIRKFLTAAALLGSLALGQPAAALDKVNVGRAVATAFAFTPLEIGNAAGTWKSEGIELNIFSFRGDAQLQQALTAGTIDFGLGSGPAMAFAVKGVPAMAVAAFAGPPENMALLVEPDSKIKSVADLAGKKVGVTTAGSLTYWLVKELSNREKWTGAKAIKPVPMGAMRTRLAAMKNGEIDGTVNDTAMSYAVQEQGAGKVLFLFGDIVKDFHTHVIFARNQLIKENPDLVRRFLRGWFKTIAVMKKDRALAVRVGAEVMKISPKVVDKVYDTHMKMLSDDGHFDPKAVNVIRRSLVELKILDHEPDPKQMYTDKFVPVRLSGR